jgi:hypothetical protein
MAKYGTNERVLFQVDGRRLRGKVTQILPQARRVVTDTGQRVVVPVRRLKRSPDMSLILETRLDRSLRSERTYAEMMHRWLRAYGIEALVERVHTLDSLRRFLRREGRNVATRFIHIIGHGTDDPGKRSVSLYLTFERVDLVENVEIFAGLEGKVLIFSCCQIGADRAAMEEIKRVSGAAAVIAYRVTVSDWYTNLVEALIYDRLVNTRLSPQAAVGKIAGALDGLGVRVDDVVTRKPVVVCV